MSRLVQFIKYFLIFITFYILVNVISFHALKSNYRTKTVNIDMDCPKVVITEFKATITNGYIDGVLYNNTKEKLVDKYLRLDFYSKRDVLLGTKYIKIEELLEEQNQSFSTKFNFDEVDSVRAMLVDGKSVVGESKLKFLPDDLSLNSTNKFILFFAFLTSLPLL